MPNKSLLFAQAKGIECTAGKRGSDLRYLGRWSYCIENKVNRKQTNRKTMRIISTSICVFLGFFAALNIIFVIAGMSSKDGLPNVFGYVPVIENTQEMVSEDSPIKKGSVVLFYRDGATAASVGDIIAYRIDEKLFISRIVEAEEQASGLVYTVKSDNVNNSVTISSQNIVGTYKGKIALLGGLILFSQTMLGLGVLVIVPIFIYVSVDYVTRKRDEARLTKEYQNQVVPVSVITPASIITPVSVIEPVNKSAESKYSQ